MREILFRGKRFDEDEWIYGSLLENDIIVTKGATDVDDDYIGFSDDWSSVVPETVGQYTGLMDKNGKRIFEGDIVEGHCHSAWSHRLQRCEISYGRDGFEARHHIDGIESNYYTYKVMFSKDVVIIGNIYDNPELLQGGEE